MLVDRIATWSKWRVLAVWWVVQALLLLGVWAWFWVTIDVRFKGSVAADLSRGVNNLAGAIVQIEFWGWYLASAAAIGLPQVAMLVPVRRPMPRWKPGSGQHGRSMWGTIAMAGLMIGLLWGGVVLVIGDVVWLASDLDWGDMDEAWRWLVIPPAVGWIVATPLLVRFVQRGRREDRLGRLASRLFLGTIVEAVAIIPLDVMVRRKTDCYCERGTFVALVVCGTVGLAALGPAVLLPVLSRRRKRWYSGHCEACGYDMSGTPGAERCPECGAGWKAEEK